MWKCTVHRKLAILLKKTTVFISFYIFRNPSQIRMVAVILGPVKNKVVVCATATETRYVTGDRMNT